MNQMTTDQALQILRETTARIQADLSTHQAIITAIDTLEKATSPVDTDTKKEGDS